MREIQPQSQGDFCNQQQSQQVREHFKRVVVFSDGAITASEP